MKVVKYFPKKLHLRCLTRFGMCFWCTYGYIPSREILVKIFTDKIVVLSIFSKLTIRPALCFNASKVFYLTGDITNLYPFIRGSLEWLYSELYSSNASLWNQYKHIAFIPFFYKQSIFDHCPENCLSFSKKSPQKLFSNCLMDGLLTSTV